MKFDRLFVGMALRASGYLLTAAFLAMLVQAVSSGQATHPKQAVRSASRQTTARSVRQGQALYLAYQCSACHTMQGKGCVAGIELDDVARTRSEKFITDQLLDPENHVAKNVGKGMNYNPNLMPDMQISKEQVRSLYLYLRRTADRLEKKP